MRVGRFGSLGFVCSAEQVRTFTDLLRSSTVKYAEHEVIGGLPMLEFVSYGLFKASFTMRFDMSLGNHPAKSLQKLQNMMNNRQYKWLVVGDSFLGRYVIEGIHESHKYHAPDGTLLVAEVTLDLIEWSKGQSRQIKQGTVNDEKGDGKRKWNI